uniref:Ribosomal protein S12 n=1 Tax=Populus trichocarpa TaxID=3694 RepID=A0A2K2AS45_POPTR
MSTIKQLIKNIRHPTRNVTKSPVVEGCPQHRGTCTRLYVRLV